MLELVPITLKISIHEALASLDTSGRGENPEHTNFDPRGSREPRLSCRVTEERNGIYISIHEALASLDAAAPNRFHNFQISIHEALASLDIEKDPKTRHIVISIHEALASLDDMAVMEAAPCVISIHEALASLDNRGRRVKQARREFRSTRLSRASTE